MVRCTVRVEREGRENREVMLVVKNQAGLACVHKPADRLGREHGELTNQYHCFRELGNVEGMS